jgi:hypothetical protein
LFWCLLFFSSFFLSFSSQLPIIAITVTHRLFGLTQPFVCTSSKQLEPYPFLSAVAAPRKNPPETLRTPSTFDLAPFPIYYTRLL